MRQPRPQMIAGAVQENLRLVFKPPKRARVNDTSTVALEFGPIDVALAWILSAARVAGFLRERSEGGALSRLHFLARFPAVLHRAVNALMSILACRAGVVAKAGRFQSF